MSAKRPDRSFPAVFMRGGTSKGLMFLRDDLPNRDEWDAIFCGAMGSPDPYGRQLDGMGGGLSSLSKVCIVGRSSRPDADVDYTFGQVVIGERRVDYTSNCGNMSAAVGPFAVVAGLVDARGDAAVVRIFNTNTAKIIRAVFPLRDGEVTFEGALEIPGVAGAGAPIQLQFQDPGGATTGHLLPCGGVLDTLTVGSRRFSASLVDASNACAFVEAEAVGLIGDESPDSLEANREALALLGQIRAVASVRMGVAPDIEAAARMSAVPFVAVVSRPSDYESLDGGAVDASRYDLSLRVISHGQPHRAAPLTIALCTAVACKISGSIPAEIVSRTPGGSLRLGTPSGVLTVGADVIRDASGAWKAQSGTFHRTARTLFEGRVWSKG